MFRYYEVYYLETYLGTYKALSEHDAIQQCYMKTGGASAYSGRASKLYTAKCISII